ncbi:MAG: hypothetical protein AAF390_04800 [Pseudomonadota bacterium]
MSVFGENFSRFLREQRGAVTVDYVVLTAAATGLAIAAADELSAGLSHVTDVVAAELAEQGDPVDDRNVTFTKNTFHNDTADITGATVSDMPGIGKVLGPINGSTGAQTVSQRFDVGEEYESVQLDFDLYALDDLENNDFGNIYIDGKKVGYVSVVDEKAVFTPEENNGNVEITATVVDAGVQLGGIMKENSGTDDFGDSKVAISITVKDPVGAVDLGFGAKTSAGASNESFAIDDLVVTGRKKAPEPVEADPSI